MTLRPALLASAMLLLANAMAVAQSAAPSPSPLSQLDRIEATLDELLRRVPGPQAEGQATARLSRPEYPLVAPPQDAQPSLPLPGGGPGSGSRQAPPFRPGALAVVHPAPAQNAVLAVPSDSVGGFVFTGDTLRLDDLSGRGLRYRGQAGIELEGWLRAREDGRYQFAVDFGSPQAGNTFTILTCGAALWLEGREVGQRTGNFNLQPDSAPVLSLVLGAELSPGFYRMRLWLACGRTGTPMPIPSTVDLLIKTPSELNLRAITAEDVVHREG